MKSPLTCRILYVEDNEDSSEMMKVLLGFAGIDVITARKIAEAWMLAQSENFDLFLLDSQFPDGDGLELCRRLRQHFSNTPIFFIRAGLIKPTGKTVWLLVPMNILLSQILTICMKEFCRLLKSLGQNESQSRTKGLNELNEISCRPSAEF